MSFEPLLVDTNVSSYLLHAGSPLAAAYADLTRGHALFISPQTYAEHWHGARRAGWGAHRLAQLKQHLGMFALVEVDIVTCKAWGELRTYSERMGRPLSVQDAWVAAVAVANGLPLVCHDGDLHGLGFPGLELRAVSTH